MDILLRTYFRKVGKGIPTGGLSGREQVDQSVNLPGFTHLKTSARHSKIW